LSKDDLIDMQGTVVAVHSGGLYRVQCDAGHEVLAQTVDRQPRSVVTQATIDPLGQRLFVVALGWLLRGPAAPSWGLVLTAAALVVVHLAAAFAGQMPSYARVHRAALRRWWLPGAIAVVLTPAVAVATALIRGADVPGSLLVTVAAITLTATTIWFAAGQKLGRD